jgi:medium-chain acyl-[acyl-carrier-protein] hydrolase
MRIETWFHCRRPNPQARLRLLCFPYAGGGVAVFRAWPSLLPAAIEVWALQLPGRDGRLREAIPAGLPALAAALADGLVPQLDRPFACFGHSMGALLAFEFARQLRQRGQAGPEHLLVSARRAPHLPRTEAPLHALPEGPFIEMLRQRYNGIPAAVLAEPELMQLFLPMLRADFRLIETYAYQSEEPLACPISAYGGAEDPWARPEELAAWQAQTRGAFHLQVFPGGHFYLQEALPQLLGSVSHALLPDAAPGL